MRSLLKMDMEKENFLRSLGLKWIEVAEAMSDEKRDKTCRLIEKNPQITKKEFLEEMDIQE